MIRRIQSILLFLTGYALPLAAFSLFDIGGFRMTPFKLITILLLALAALNVTLGARRPRFRDRNAVWVGLYATAVTIAIIQGFVRGVPAPPLFAEATTYYSIIIFYFLVAITAGDLAGLRTVLWGLALGGVTTSLPAVLGLQRAGEGGRFTGLSGQENVLGADMAIAAPVAIALLMASRSRGARLVLMGSVFVIIGGLLLSLSRTAFVASFFMWALWVYRSGRIDTIRYALPAVVILAGVVLMAPEAVIDRIESVTDPQRRLEDASIQSRLLQVEFSAKAFVASPVVGVGMLHFPQWAQQQPGGRGIRHVIHNGYLGVLVAQGLVGFIPFLMMLATGWMQYSQAWRAARARHLLRDPTLIELGTYAMLLQVALFGAIIGGLANITHKSKTMWLVLALAPVVRGLTANRLEEIESTGTRALPAPKARGILGGTAAPGPAWTSPTS